MKILDKYIVKNFLIGYAIAFGVFIGLRIIIELFVNLDEFTEKVQVSTLEVIKNIIVFYGIRITLYFRDFAGMITVMAAAFSFGKMVRTGELVAVMASGVSLRRLVVPVVILALISTAFYVIDQELIIPPLADKLIRGEDELAGREFYDVRFVSDNYGSLIFSQQFSSVTETLDNPTIILRQKTARPGIWELTGWISADEAIFDPEKKQWDLINGRSVDKNSIAGPKRVSGYSSDITPHDIPIRQKAEHKSLLSFVQLSKIASEGSKIKDLAQIYAQMHSHITDPIINLIMLLISLPILICRDPRSMKTAIIISFAITTLCYIATFICKLFATEFFFERLMPEFWVWLPVLIFLPAAVIELDSMKT